MGLAADLLVTAGDTRGCVPGVLVVLQDVRVIRSRPHPPWQTEWMPDALTSDERSKLMARIKGADTKPELKVRSLLYRLGFRFRLHRHDLPGKPDIVLLKHQAVVFVNGCFWHHHTCKVGHVPKSRADYWGPKLARTKARDARDHAALAALGWRIKVVWECEVADTEALGRELQSFLVGRPSSSDKLPRDA